VNKGSNRQSETATIFGIRFSEFKKTIRPLRNDFEGFFFASLTFPSIYLGKRERNQKSETPAIL